MHTLNTGERRGSRRFDISSCVLAVVNMRRASVRRSQITERKGRKVALKKRRNEGETKNDERRKAETGDTSPRENTPAKRLDG